MCRADRVWKVTRECCKNQDDGIREDRTCEKLSAPVHFLKNEMKLHSSEQLSYKHARKIPLL